MSEEVRKVGCVSFPGLCRGQQRVSQVIFLPLREARHGAQDDVPVFSWSASPAASFRPKREYRLTL